MNDLAGTLERARMLLDTLSRAHGDFLTCDNRRALNAERAYDLADGRSFVRDLTSGDRRAPNTELAHDLGGARILAYDLACDLTGARGLGSTSGLARDLDRVLALSRALDPDSAIDFDRALDYVRTLIARLECLVNALHCPGGAYGLEAWALTRESGEGRSAIARRFLRAAARVLPAGDRARYGEEFESELADIARANGGRLTQLAFAIRVVASSLRLRLALVSPRRRGAVQ